MPDAASGAGDVAAGLLAASMRGAETASDVRDPA